MKRTIMSDRGSYDLDSMESIYLSEDCTAILMSMKSGVVSTLFSTEQIVDEIRNDPYFFPSDLVGRALFFLQHTILHAAAYPEISIDFEAILEDMYTSTQAPEKSGDEEESGTLELPFPTADVVSRYLLTPGPFDEDGEDPDPYGDLEPDYSDEEDDLEEDQIDTDDAACDATPQTAEDKATPP